MNYGPQRLSIGTAFLAYLLFAATIQAQIKSPTVGIEGAHEALLSEPNLKAKPAERTSPLTLRIASIHPHGTLFRYDLRYIGLVPGEFDLGEYLLRQDGTRPDYLPRMNVEIAGILPPQHGGQLAPRDGGHFASLASYRWLIGGAVALWALTGIPLFVVGRRRKEAAALSNRPRPPTPGERLRPLVQLAAARKLNADQQAQLERMLLGHWRERLGLESLEPSEAMVRLHAHPEASVLLRALEQWLHCRPGTANVDLEAVLAPYGQRNGADVVNVQTS